MSPGRGKPVTSMMLALGAMLAAASPAAAAPAATTSIAQVHPSAGARAAEVVTVFEIHGAPTANRFNVYPTIEGGIAISSPEGITAPVTPSGECRQDSTTLVSCVPGYVDALAGHLGAGDDTLTTGANLPIPIGAQFGEQRRLVNGGPGNDRLVGGAAGDAITGNRGNDTVIGRRGPDALFGGAGRDNLSGGRGSDALFGGGGADKLNGGPGLDLCAGGGGRDSGRACEVPKRIP